MTESLRVFHVGRPGVTPPGTASTTITPNRSDSMSQQMTTKSKFHPGRIVATPAALEVIQASGQSPEIFIGAHLEGYWGGDLCEEDRQLNDVALIDGSRLLSAYSTLRGIKLWIITEAVGNDGRRASTCLLRPEEY
jgi:hypothetical protein